MPMSENGQKNVILITDGDDVAAQAIQQVAADIGGRCISRSSGNPTHLTGEELVEQILRAKGDPVLVMFDDNGHMGLGEGERALCYVARHRRIRVLGAIAVASNTGMVRGTHIDLSIDARGQVVTTGVDKYGNKNPFKEKRVYGDTVDVLGQLNIPLIIGIGDIGKMQGRDDIHLGAPITLKAVNMILERSGLR